MYQAIINHILEQKNNLTKLMIDHTKNPIENKPNTISYDNLITLSEINKIKEDIAADKVNPKDDWDYEFIPKVKKNLIYDQIEHFRCAILRQIAFIAFISDIKIDIALENDSGVILEHKIACYIQEAQSALQWGYAYWSAYNISDIIANRKIENIPSKGGQQRAKQLEEERSIFECLVRINLKKQRPIKGWKDEYNAAASLAEILSSIINENDFPITNDSDKLYEKILKLIDSDTSKLRKVYKDNL